MINLNKPYGINSVERMTTGQKEKVLYLDEAQFRLVHQPKPTDSWKKIEEKFGKRKEIEKEKEIEKKKIEELNEKIVELANKVREEEHEKNEQDKKRLDYLNEGKIEDLKSKLMAA